MKNMKENEVFYCKYCNQFAIIDRKLMPTQKYTCGKEECQNKRHYEKCKKLMIKSTINWQKSHPERFKEIQKRWRQNHKEQWNKNMRMQSAKWVKNHPEEWRKSIQKWRKTENGRKYEERHRHRRYGYLEVLPNIFEDCLIDRHHINKQAPIVIPIPRKVHLYGNHWRSNIHFDKCNDFIEKTYMINSNIFLGEFNNARL